MLNVVKLQTASGSQTALIDDVEKKLRLGNQTTPMFTSLLNENSDLSFEQIGHQITI